MKAKVVWAKAVWEVFEELQKRKLPRLWNAWISSDTSLTYTPCARAAVFAAIVFFRQATGSYSIRLWKARFISAVSGRRAFPELSFPFSVALVSSNS